MRDLVTVIAALAVALPLAASEPFGLPLEGEAALHFLRHAELVEMQDIERGITKPRRAVLSDGERQLKAVFKTVDEERSFQRFERKRAEIGFRDSYKHEIAAYELDRLLGLGLVPPTVARTFNGERGSLQLWIEGVMTEGERIKAGLDPPRPQEWNNQIYTIRLFLQLTYDTDYNNVSNLLVDPEYRIYAIDFSRAFRLHKKLRREESLSRFSRRALGSLRELSFRELDETMRPWLSKAQIRALWKRRERILELADELVAAKGELVVLYP